MTTTPPEAPSERPHEETGSAAAGPRTTGDEIRDLGRLRRTTDDRKVAGVAGGLARHLDIDPILLRVGFVVLAFFGGAGLILYAAGWLLVPEEGDERATLHLDERSRGIVLVALAVIAALALIGDSWGAFWFPWPLAIIGLIAFVWLSRHREDRRGRESSAATAVESLGESSAPSYVAPAPRDPRRRGPILFWFTLLLIAVAEGVLGIADGAGAAIADSAYAALAVGLIALMLLVGSVMGRAGGLIALGLLASVILAGATVADRWDGERSTYRPATAAAIEDSYAMDRGTLLLDLTNVDDVEALDGRTIEVRGEAGQLVIRVPREVSVRALVDIDGPGGYDLFDRQTGGGLGTSTTAQHDAGDDAPALVVDAALEVGQITIETE